MNNASQKFMAEMQAKLTTYFNGEEVETIAFVLGIDYDSLRGATKPTKVNSLLYDVARNGRLPELLAHVGDSRRNVEWPALPPNFELPQGAAGSETGGTTIHNINTGGGAYISGGNFSAGGNLSTGRADLGSGALGKGPAGDPRARFLHEVAALKSALAGLPSQHAREAGTLARRVDLLAEELAADDFDGETVLDLAQAVRRAAEALAQVSPAAVGRAGAVVELATQLAR
ncbi:protein of unknown function [Candidatus Promineifilum breve]|uniref:Effector-associated domain-containing protein n=1 Tax=Candidatus Promineifilum breve TaxID=1806508 RepID=A0A161K3V4_9CHLR|nr:hypothetical protein [Candidatus Promineifilum breve]CUS05797.1 protein of unknown function [Candidatus Promineifilum breve]